MGTQLPQGPGHSHGHRTASPGRPAPQPWAAGLGPPWHCPSNLLPRHHAPSPALPPDSCHSNRRAAQVQACPPPSPQSWTARRPPRGLRALAGHWTRCGDGGSLGALRPPHLAARWVPLPEHSLGPRPAAPTAGSQVRPRGLLLRPYGCYGKDTVVWPRPRPTPSARRPGQCTGQTGAQGLGRTSLPAHPAASGPMLSHTPPTKPPAGLPTCQAQEATLTTVAATWAGSWHCPWPETKPKPD